jgi:hypothetical protein
MHAGIRRPRLDCYVTPTNPYNHVTTAHLGPALWTPFTITRHAPAWHQAARGISDFPLMDSGLAEEVLAAHIYKGDDAPEGVKRVIRDIILNLWFGDLVGVKPKNILE